MRCWVAVRRVVRVVLRRKVSMVRLARMILRNVVCKVLSTWRVLDTRKAHMVSFQMNT